MADVKMSEMAAVSPAVGTEKILVLDVATSKTMLASVLSAYVIDNLVGAAEITPTAGDAFVVERSGTEGTYAIADAEAWVVDTIEAVPLDTSILASDHILFSDGGVLNRITLANLLAAAAFEVSLSSIDIDGGTDIAEDLVDADEIIVDNGGGGTNRRCDVSRIFDYVEDKIQALSQKTTPLDADILTIQDTAASNALKELTVGQLWDNRYLADMLAVTDVSTASWVIHEDTLVSNSATKVPTQQSVKQYVDTNTWDGKITDLTLMAGTPSIADGDLVAVSDEGETNDPTRAVTLTEFFTAAGDLTDLAGAPNIADRLLVTDEDVADDPAKSMSVQNLMDVVDDQLTQFTGAIDVDADQLLIHDDSDGASERMTVQVLFDGIGDLVAATVATTDSMVFVDATDGAAKIESIDDVFKLGPSLATAGSINTTVDHIVFLSGGASGNARKCSVQEVFDGIDDLAATAGLLVPGTDAVLFDNGGTAEKCTVQVLFDGIGDLGAGVIATTDSVVFVDAGDGVAKIESVDDLFGIGPALTAAGTVDVTADHMLFLDGGASGTAKKCSIQSVFDGVNDLAAIGTAPDTTDNVLLDDAGTAKKCTVANLFSSYFNDMATTAGAGITGGADNFASSVEKVGTLYKTTILIDVDGLNSGANANDIIGLADTANCSLGQITAARNGTIFAGTITCIEVPTNGDDDIDLWDAVESTGTEDTDIEDVLTGEHQLTDGGDWTTVGQVVPLTVYPTANEYLYLCAGTGDKNLTYTAGIFLIELWGK
jgi:hypothetical protein